MDTWLASPNDILGPSCEVLTLPLEDDFEGPVVASLVKRRAKMPGAAVLCLPGYNDYIFHRHVADFFNDRGINFYGLDFRKYGRAWKAHQTRYLCQSLAEYFTEIDSALDMIRSDGNRQILLSGHSMGGLIAALWQNQAASGRAADALFLNSPFLSTGLPKAAQLIINPMLGVVARRHPTAAVPGSMSSRYARSLHADYGGEWTFDVTWKSTDGTRLRIAWLAAVHAGQREVRVGLDIPEPILVLCSSRSCSRRASLSEISDCDAVLDVKRMVEQSLGLGRNVTCVQVDNAVHDVLLSTQTPREQSFTVLGEWMSSALGWSAT
jgi:alpha-beta hydrolase superfamily lysophospholipase